MKTKKTIKTMKKYKKIKRKSLAPKQKSLTSKRKSKIPESTLKSIARIFAKTLIQKIFARVGPGPTRARCAKLSLAQLKAISSATTEGLLGRTRDFVKYHNAFTIILIITIIATGSVMASEPGREMLDKVIGEGIIIETGIDNTALLQADLSIFDLAMTINAVSEDENNYYVDYSFNTLGIIDNTWQAVFYEETMRVSKLGLGDNDLGLYLTEELGEIVHNTIKFLGEMQTKELVKGKTEIVETAEYTGLIGVVLDVKNKVLSGYEPVISEPKPEICDGLDNDLDGEIDEDLAVYSGSNAGQCQPAITDCVNGEMIQTQTEIGASDEICGDGIDNDCDGEIDEGDVCDVCNICGVPSALPSVASAEAEEGAEPELPADVCDLEHIALCDTQELCEGISLYWHNNTCNVEPEPELEPEFEPEPVPTCGVDNLDLCGTQELCEVAGLYWYNEVCNLEVESPADEPLVPVEPVCDLDHIDLCNTQELCEGISLFWYNEVCNTEEQEIVVCVSEWSCSGWLPLPETIACGDAFSQTQTCDDLNNCGIDDGKPAEEQEAIGTDASACGASSCDATISLTGECANICNESVCEICVPICVCADGFFDCDSDLTNGCETQGVCE